MSIPEKPGDSVRTVPSPVQDVLSQVEETLREPDPAKRSRRLRVLRDVLKIAASRAETYLEDTEREKEALVARDEKLRRDAEMNADIREQLIRRGVATAEQLDELGLHSLDRYNQLAEAGELELGDGTILQIESVSGFECDHDPSTFVASEHPVAEAETSPEAEQFLKEQPEIDSSKEAAPPEDGPSGKADGGGGCPHCGSTRLAYELRDGDGPPSAYGDWVICLECRREWPDPFEAELDRIVDGR